MTTLTLNDLNFSDLYLRLDMPDKAKYLAREKASTVIPLMCRTILTRSSNG